MWLFGRDLSEKPLKNLAKASDFQAEYEGSIPFTRSNFSGASGGRRGSSRQMFTFWSRRSSLIVFIQTS